MIIIIIVINCRDWRAWFRGTAANWLPAAPGSPVAVRVLQHHVVRTDTVTVAAGVVLLPTASSSSSSALGEVVAVAQRFTERVHRLLHRPLLELRRRVARPQRDVAGVVLRRTVRSSVGITRRGGRTAPPAGPRWSDLVLIPAIFHRVDGYLRRLRPHPASWSSAVLQRTQYHFVCHGRRMAVWLTDIILSFVADSFRVDRSADDMKWLVTVRCIVPRVAAAAKLRCRAPAVIVTS